MTDTHETPNTAPDQGEPPITIREILKENWVLARALVFFVLMLFVPLFLAWKLDLFTVANP